MRDVEAPCLFNHSVNNTWRLKINLLTKVSNKCETSSYMAQNKNFTGECKIESFCTVKQQTGAMNQVFYNQRRQWYICSVIQQLQHNLMLTIAQLGRLGPVRPSDLGSRGLSLFPRTESQQLVLQHINVKLVAANKKQN